jgi:CubicO group peptidase (beta-lactamase class C family)
LALAGLFPVTVLAQTDVTAKIEAIRATNHLPAMSAMVIKDARIMAQGVTGVRRVGSSVPLTLDDRVNVGSCSKFITATVAARLIDRGLLQWTSRIRDIFPDKVSTYNSAFLDVTLNDILAHRAGVQEQNTFNARHWNDLFSVNGTIVQMRAWVCDKVLTDAPQVPLGTFLYSNQGYSVAAAMMERVTGKSWEQLVQEEVFGPLRMTSAFMGISYDDNPVPAGPVGHEFANTSATTATPEALQPSTVMIRYQASNGPGGYVVCTLADYAKFLNAYVGGEASTYLTTATRTKMLTPWFTGTAKTDNDYYAHGVYSIPSSAQPWAAPGVALNHLGDIFGEDTLFWAAPGKNFIVVMYANCAESDARSTNALNAVASLMINTYSGVTTAAGPYLEGPSNAAAVKSGNTFTLTAKTLPTGVYQLQSSTNFTTWTNSGAAVTATDWTTNFAATISGTQHPYYRIKTVP